MTCCENVLNEVEFHWRYIFKYRSPGKRSPMSQKNHLFLLFFFLEIVFGSDSYFGRNAAKRRFVAIID